MPNLYCPAEAGQWYQNYLVLMLVKWSEIFLFILVNISILCAAFEPKTCGVVQLGCGDAGRAWQGNSFALFRNPALLQADTSTLDLFYKNYYEIESLNQIALQGQLPLGRFPLAVGILHYGSGAYTEQDLRLGSAIDLRPGLRLGIAIRILRLAITGYGSNQTLAIDAGLHYEMLSGLQAAWVIENLNRPQIGRAKERLPQTMVLAFAYHPHQQVQSLLDVVKEDGFDFDIRSGIAYHLAIATFMAGFRSLVETWHGGVMFQWGKIRLGYALEYHPQLGASHALEAGFAF